MQLDDGLCKEAVPEEDLSDQDVPGYERPDPIREDRCDEESENDAGDFSS